MSSSHAWLCASLGLALLQSGCDGAVSHSPGGKTQAPRAADVVAEVNGDAIRLNEVKRVCEATGLAPEVALSRLIDQRLLAQYSEASGYGALATTVREVERARVRALLETVIEAQAGEAVEARKQLLERFLRDLRDKTPVVYDEPAVQRALADDLVLGRGT